MQARPLKILIHITAWALLMLVPLLSSPPSGPMSPALVPRPAPLFHLLFTAVLAVAFYFNQSILVPRLFLRGRRAVYGLAAIAVIVSLSIVFQSILLLGPRQTLSGARVPVLPLAMLVLIMLVSTSLRLAEEWARVKQREGSLAKERSEQELQALQARIDPHYLFNALNSIYGLAVANDPRTSDAILQLSGLMRYVFDRGTNDRVPLAEEIGHIRSYIDLQSLRSNAHMTVDMNVQGVGGSNRIAPLLLQPFVENAFKHGTSTSAASPIRIGIRVEDARLMMHVINRIHRDRPGSTSQGIGLVDVRRRLELIYPGKYRLDIRTEGDEHHVLLSIDLA